MNNCESCGMPLDETSVSKLDSRYCVHCQNQENGELKSREEVREGSIAAAINLLGKTPEEAEKMADDMMPNLPRWKEENTVTPVQNEMEDVMEEAEAPVTQEESVNTETSIPENPEVKEDETKDSEPVSPVEEEAKTNEINEIVAEGSNTQSAPKIEEQQPEAQIPEAESKEAKGEGPQSL